MLFLGKIIDSNLIKLTKFQMFSDFWDIIQARRQLFVLDRNLIGTSQTFLILASIWEEEVEIGSKEMWKKL